VPHVANKGHLRGEVREALRELELCLEEPPLYHGARGAHNHDRPVEKVVILEAHRDPSRGVLRQLLELTL
jgi:hypothetical protein